MRVEFIGIAGTADRSETIAETGPAVQPEDLYHLAATHEQSGFDRVLVAHSSSSPDGFIVADQVLNATSRLGVLLAHRPGFVAPTIAARKFATIDAFYPGRIALHVVTGADDGDQARDGDFSDKATRYRRTDEFLDVVELAWSSEQRFGYDGEFYRVADAWSALRPPGGHLPGSWAAATPPRLRDPGGCCSSPRRGEVHDKRLWTVLSQATGAAGNSTALVGSYEQVAESLLDYVAVGASTLLIRGYDPLLDAAAYADLIRLVHEQVGEDIDSYPARVAA